MSTLRRTETDLTRFYGMFPQPDLARDLFNLIEGHRIDTRMRTAYPGIRHDLWRWRSAGSPLPRKRTIPR